jgi:cobalamin-dependent methionine synthase I
MLSFLRLSTRIARGGMLVFTVVAERINCTRKTIQEATENRDAAFIQQEAVKQAEAGATYIDVNVLIC